MLALAGRVAAAIDRINGVVGRTICWLTLALVLWQFVVVVLRYVFGTSFVAFQEAVIYIHAAVFMFGAGFTLLVDGHVRVDILYGESPPRRKAWIDLLGVVFLLIPGCVAVLAFTSGFVLTSWQILEGPLNVGGIPALFVLKSLIPVFAVLVLLQGLSMGLKAAIALHTDGDYPARPGS